MPEHEGEPSAEQTAKLERPGAEQTAKLEQPTPIGLWPAETVDGPPRRTLPALVLPLVLALFGLGPVAYGMFLLSREPDRPAARQPSAAASVPAAASAPAPAPPGPRPADRPVRDDRDLAQVCGGWYFPAAPPYTGKAPHPVSISVRARLDDQARTSRILNTVAYGGSVAKRQAWAPAPAKAQVVACLDLVGGGPKLRDCKSDDAKPVTLPLLAGEYRLALIEVATGRRLVEAKLTGSTRGCPLVTVYGADRNLYSEVDDRQLHAALRKRVEG